MNLALAGKGDGSLANGETTATFQRLSYSNWFDERRIIIFWTVHPLANRPHLHLLSRIGLQQSLQIAILDLPKPFRVMLLSQDEWHPRVNLSN